MLLFYGKTHHVLQIQNRKKRERETLLLKAELLNIQSFSLPSLLILFIACLQVVGLRPTETARIYICLLYTSDAADE